jgi:hypothetical protein
MSKTTTTYLAAALSLNVLLPALSLGAQDTHHAGRHATAPPPGDSSAPAATGHSMWMRSLPGGWHAMGMAQVFPTVTAGTPWREETLLNASGVYATQPAVMLNISSPGARLVLRTTLDLEAWTQRDGELTFGGWGEGFIDSRHPHTVLHEAMLTANWWEVKALGGGALSLSAGKGFAPYGTDDPMGRPAVKFPTNHHLSQILERFTVNAAYLVNGWSVEAGVFGGTEPRDPYDFRNIESFGDSWSARIARRFGAGFGPDAEWELSASYARVAEQHHGEKATTVLQNAALRHAAANRFGTLYALVEGSRSDPDGAEGYHALLGEALLATGRDSRHQPYLRVEYATRPEYERLGAPGTPDFFRYDHDAHHEIGATRWMITTLGYGYETSGLPTSVRPYIELQQHHVRAERGGVDPRALFGSRDFWSVSAGARIFFGGGPMRMGSYGVLDPMAAAMRPRSGMGAPRD